MTDPLMKWRAAAGGRLSDTAEILVLGDSNDECGGARYLHRRWQAVLQRTLRARLATDYGAAWPYIAANYAHDYPGRPVTVAGSVSDENGFGMGKRCLRLRDPGARVTFTFIGTWARLLYTMGTNAGRIVIDLDGDRSVVDSYLSSGTQVGTWSAGPLDRKVHTLTVSVDPTSTKHGFIEGLVTHDGDEYKSVRVIDAAHSSLAAHEFAADRMWAVSARQAADGQACGYGLLIYGLGTNDYGDGRSAEQYEADTRKVLATLREQGFDGSVLLLHKWKGHGRSEAGWTAYRDALARIAADDPDTALLDLRPSMPDPVSADGSGALGLYTDALHLSDRGHGVVADLITARLLR